MVAKRQCSFCAQEIEPGTGTMFVKRDGTVFQFCSSSCRKQQLGLGRIGHRLKWTRAYALKRAAERSSGARPTPSAGGARAPSASGRATVVPTPTAPESGSAAHAAGATAPTAEGSSGASRPKPPAKAGKAPAKPAAKRAPKPSKSKPDAPTTAKPTSDDA